MSGIAAIVYISESEIAKYYEDYDASWEEEYPNSFKKILWKLGLDVNTLYQRQDGLFHRNRLNEVVFCSRWVGCERLDKEWIESGYASQEAIDKASGSKLIKDLYRLKGGWEDE